MAIDQARLEAFMHQFAGDFGAAMHAATVVIGDKLGLYRAPGRDRPHRRRAGSPTAAAATPAWSRSGSTPSTSRGYCQLQRRDRHTTG